MPVAGAKGVVKPEFNEYHLIRTLVFTSFKPPSAQSEASRMGGGSTSADVSRKIFGIEVTSALEYKCFLIEEISAQVYIPRWQPHKKSFRIFGQQSKISTNTVKLEEHNDFVFNEGLAKSTKTEYFYLKFSLLCLPGDLIKYSKREHLVRDL